MNNLSSANADKKVDVEVFLSSKAAFVVNAEVSDSINVARLKCIRALEREKKLLSAPHESYAAELAEEDTFFKENILKSESNSNNYINADDTEEICSYFENIEYTVNGFKNPHNSGEFSLP